jgi:hypothetical protein
MANRREEILRSLEDTINMRQLETRPWEQSRRELQSIVVAGMEQVYKDKVDDLVREALEGLEVNVNQE